VRTQAVQTMKPTTLLAARAVESAVDAALGELVRQCGTIDTQILVEARGAGMLAAKVYLERLDAGTTLTPSMAPMTDAELANYTRHGLAYAAAEIIQSTQGYDHIATLRRLTIGDFGRLADVLLELRDAIRDLHALVKQTDPNDPIGVALTKVGLERVP
jgi:hypothetical protein